MNPVLSAQLRAWTDSNVRDPLQPVKAWNGNCPPSLQTSRVTVAAVGDLHGHFNELSYSLEAKHGVVEPGKPFADLVLQVGDLQPIRNEIDMDSMVVPNSHRKLGSFSDFDEQRIFPIPMVFVGGNHEPHNFLERLAPNDTGLFKVTENIFYGGRVMAYDYHGLKIVGVSGIYGENYYHSKRPSTLPEQPGPKAVNYKPWVYFNEDDIMLAKKMFSGAHIMVVHDWPAHLSDLLHKRTIRGKIDPEFAHDANHPMLDLLRSIKPDLLLCGHHHHFLGGRIFWKDAGHATEVLCLDKFDKFRPANDENLVNIEFGVDGLRVLQR